MLSQETLDGMGGADKALVGEDVGQTLLAKVGGVCLGLHHGIYDVLRLGGAVDMGRTIPGGQTPLRGLLAILRKGLSGDAEEPGDHDHTEDLRRDQSQYAAFEVVQLGLSLYGQ
jgi:hypothetical protein